MEYAERASEAMDVIAAGGGPAGLMTAALPDAAGVRAEACERGSEPTRQSRGTARHPRTLEVLTMIDAGDGRRISDVLLAQGRRVPGHAPRRDARPARLPRPGHAVPVHADAPAVGAEHALAVYLDARGVPVRHGAEVTAAGQSTDEAPVQVSGARHTARYLAGPAGAHNAVRQPA
jgi:2-polyprenyl-6-methoxyphenol hydroxylase-like FAD-dependent oxidoreductase